MALGRHIGVMVCVMGTRSLSLRRAMSLSKLRKLNDPAMALRTNLDSGFFVSRQRSCSPNVTLIMNHMNLEFIEEVYLVKKSFTNVVLIMNLIGRVCYYLKRVCLLF